MPRNKKKMFSLKRETVSVLIIMMLFMTVYESVKQILFPNISIWGSHAITILFTSVLATFIAFYMLARLYREYNKRVRETEMRKRNEEALQERERRWIALINNPLIGIYQCFLNGDFLLVNDKFAAMAGYSSQEEFLLAVPNISALYKDPSNREQLVEKLKKEGALEHTFVNLVTRNGGDRWCDINAILANPDGDDQFIESYVIDITELKAMQDAREELVEQLQESLAQIKVLNGMLPICANCKKIRDDKGYWNQIETYIRDHSDAEFSHSICPDCAKKLYPGMKLKSPER